MSPSETSSSSGEYLPPSSAAGQAVLTEAVRHVDIVHTSLAGMTAIVATLLVAVALPVFGLEPVTYPAALVIMTLTSFVGIGGMYYINYRVHRHVSDQARLTEVLVNSLGQGFFSFGQDGVCGKVYSQACLTLLEGSPAERQIADVLRVAEEARSDFSEWVSVLFQPDHALAFQDVVKFLPQSFPHSGQLKVDLIYRPIYGGGGRLSNVVVIATDQTDERIAQEHAVRQQAFAEMVCRVFRERNQFNATMAGVKEFLDISGAPGVWLKDAPALLRQLHTLKAGVRHFKLLDLGDVIHEVESDLRAPEITDDETFRNEIQKGRKKITDSLAEVVKDIGDLMGGSSGESWRGNVREIEEDDLYEFAREMRDGKAPPELVHLYLSRIAAVPIRDCFRSFERGLMELSGTMDKQIKQVAFKGSNPRVLTQPLQGMFMSFNHICRNIVDHGIESPVTRMARGKDAAGQVVVSTDVIPSPNGEGGQWLKIVISDDGNGIDPSRVRSRLATVDPYGDWRFEDDQAVIQRIFSWGITTADSVTAMSGRGVGLEAVEREVKLLGGTIKVESEPYKGASFDIQIPYRLEV